MNKDRPVDTNSRPQKRTGLSVEDEGMRNHNWTTGSTRRNYRETGYPIPKIWGLCRNWLNLRDLEAIKGVIHLQAFCCCIDGQAIIEPLLIVVSLFTPVCPPSPRSLDQKVVSQWQASGQTDQPWTSGVNSVQQEPMMEMKLCGLDNCAMEKEDNVLEIECST
uniref:Uncharacterized protein n=1 Tax=Romanomermis culicivorax TaxID=13658 RepID=A0A915JFW2_ROMCU